MENRTRDAVWQDGVLRVFGNTSIAVAEGRLPLNRDVATALRGTMGEGLVPFPVDAGGGRKFLQVIQKIIAHATTFQEVDAGGGRKFQVIPGDGANERLAIAVAMARLEELSAEMEAIGGRNRDGLEHILSGNTEGLNSINNKGLEMLANIAKDAAAVIYRIMRASSPLADDIVDKECNVHLGNIRGNPALWAAKMLANHASGQNTILVELNEFLARNWNELRIEVGSWSANRIATMQEIRKLEARLRELQARLPQGTELPGDLPCTIIPYDELTAYPELHRQLADAGLTADQIPDLITMRDTTVPGLRQQVDELIAIKRALTMDKETLNGLVALLKGTKFNSSNLLELVESGMTHQADLKRRRDRRERQRAKAERAARRRGGSKQPGGRRTGEQIICENCPDPGGSRSSKPAGKRRRGRRK